MARVRASPQLILVLLPRTALHTLALRTAALVPGRPRPLGDPDLACSCGALIPRAQRPLPLLTGRGMRKVPASRLPIPGPSQLGQGLPDNLKELEAAANPAVGAVGETGRLLLVAAAAVRMHRWAAAAGLQAARFHQLLSKRCNGSPGFTLGKRRCLHCTTAALVTVPLQSREMQRGAAVFWTLA